MNMALSSLLKGFSAWVRGQITQPDWKTKHFLLLLAQFVFTGMYVLSNPALEHLPPLVFAALRLAIALPFLFIISMQEGKVDLAWRDYLQLFVLGLTGVGVPQTVIFVANKLAGAGLVGILIPLMTAFTALLAGLLGLERVGPLKGAGVFMAFVGAMLVALFDGTDFSQRSPWGTVAMLVNTFSYALYTNLLYFFLLRKPYPFTVYRIAVGFGLLCIIPFAAIQAYVTPVDWLHIPYWVWLVELYVGVLVTSGAHAMIAWVVRHVAPVLPGVYGALSPPLTVVMASLFLGERFQWVDIGCMVLILAGILLVVYVRANESKGNDDSSSGGMKTVSANVDHLDAAECGEEIEMLLANKKQSNPIRDESVEMFSISAGRVEEDV